MPYPRILALLFLPVALSAQAAPPVLPQPEPPQPPREAPVRPCLVNSVSCLSMAPQPFRPCLAVPQSCGDHFSITPVTNPAWTPAAWSKPR